MSRAGILAYGTYLPYWRLRRQMIGAALGTSAGSGARAVASYDEDSTSMAVEGGRAALETYDGPSPAALYLATTTPGYLDKTNATTVHAALDLPERVFAADMAGSVRSAVAMLRAAAVGAEPVLTVASDVRTGLPGSADERDGGDGAAAFVFGTPDHGAVIAEVVAAASSTREMLDRWRVPGEAHSRVWEERFGEHAYLPLAEHALTEACKSAGVGVADIDRLIVTGTSARAVRSFRRTSGVPKERLADDLSADVGNTGAANPGLLLATALDDAGPGRLLALVVLADGADAMLVRTTEAIAGYTPAATVASQVAATRDDLAYARFLTWRGMLSREPPRRPDPDRPAAPPALRNEDWKFAFVGTRCADCGERHLPPQRVCHHCHAVDRMERERLADVPGTLATYSIDRLAYSLSPPVVVGVVDFDGGGRYRCELTDVDPEAVAIGDRLRMSFRRLYTADGVHNYFWKARPLRKGR